MSRSPGLVRELRAHVEFLPWFTVGLPAVISYSNCQESLSAQQSAATKTTMNQLPGDPTRNQDAPSDDTSHDTPKNAQEDEHGATAQENVAAGPPASSTASASLNAARFSYETPSMIHLGVRRMMSVVSTLKEADRAALENGRVSSLVKESDMAAFLRTENFHVAAAVQRLVAYWKKREELFRKRAFLPVDMTGGGALDEIDISTVQLGFLSFLPHVTVDNRLVLLNDMSRHDGAAYLHHLRCLFYLLHLASVAEPKGRLDLLLFASARSFDPAWVSAVHSVSEVIPVQLSCVHYCLTVDDDVTRERVSSEFERLSGNTWRGKALLHVAKTREELIVMLKDSGYVPDKLSSLLGDASMEYFQEWMTAQLEIELEEQAACRAELSKKQAMARAKRQEDQRRHDRKMHELDREVRKVEKQEEDETRESLQEQVEELQRTKARLRQEQIYLEDNIRQTNLLAALCDHQALGGQAQLPNAASDLPWHQALSVSLQPSAGAQVGDQAQQQAETETNAVYPILGLDHPSSPYAMDPNLLSLVVGLLALEERMLARHGSEPAAVVNLSDSLNNDSLQSEALVLMLILCALSDPGQDPAILDSLWHFLCHGSPPA